MIANKESACSTNDINLFSSEEAHFVEMYCLTLEADYQEKMEQKEKGTQGRPSRQLDVFWKH